MKTTAVKLWMICLTSVGISGIALAQPTIVEPLNATSVQVAGRNLTLTVVGTNNASIATTNLTYEWQSSPVGAGTWSDVSGVEFSGQTNASLTIAPVSDADHLDYQVLVSDSTGTNSSATTLTVLDLNVLYVETCPMTNTTAQSVSVDAWMNDLQGGDGDNRLHQNSGTDGFFYSWNGSAEAFYTTCLKENGFNGATAQMPLPMIPVTTPGLTFLIDVHSEYIAHNGQDYVAVQIGGTNWYVNINPLSTPTGNSDDMFPWGTYAITFNPSQANWMELIVSGSYSFGDPNFPSIGNAASADLAGNITGFGVLCLKSGLDTHNFDNFVIAGLPPTIALPVINADPVSQTNATGSTVVFAVNATTNYTSTNGLTYQWQARPVGGGSFTLLSDSGQYSGTQSGQLQISNITMDNYQDFEVIVTDGAGSVTSAPATLTPVGIPPTLTADTTVSPNASVYAGNYATLNLAAIITGSSPLTLQWKVSANADGSGAVLVTGPDFTGLGTTNLTMVNPQVADTGYYSLIGTNTFGATNSAWTLVTVLPASAATYHFSAPVQYAIASPAWNLTAGQILTNVPGAYVMSVSVHGAPGWPVVVGSTTYDFNDGNGNIAIGNSQGSDDWGDWAIGWGLPGTTGDLNMDRAIGHFWYDTGGSGRQTITMGNLTVGHIYSAQLFSTDDRSPENLRLGDFEDPNDHADFSAIHMMGDNSYIVATFTATNSTMVLNNNISFNGQSGNFNAVVVRTLPPNPIIVKSGSDVQVSWPYGTLLEAASLNGPWVANSATSPFTLTPSTPQMFYRVQIP